MSRQNTNVQVRPIPRSPDRREEIAGHRVRKSPRLNDSERVGLMGMMSVTLQSRLDIVSALEVVQRQVRSARTAELVGRLLEEIRRGGSFSDACARYSHVFDRLALSMIRIGEKTGRLDESLEHLASLTENDLELRNRIVTACLYPLFVLALGLISIVVVVSWIIPRILTTLAIEPELLPWPTRVLLELTGLWQNLWVPLIVAAGILWSVLRLKVSRVLIDRLKLRIPLYATLHHRWALARFSRTLGTLLQSGVPILESLESVRDALGNEVMSQDVDVMIKRLRGGATVAGSLPAGDRFGPLLGQILAVGQETGELGSMLLTAAGSFEKQTENAIRRVMALLPAVLILLLAVVIGFVVAATILPIVNLETAAPGF